MAIMTSLLSLSYWFNVRPIPFVPVVDKALIIGFGVLFLIGIGGFLLLLKHGWSKTAKKIIARFANTLTWIGLLGAMLWSFNYEQVVILSMRVFFLPLIVWLGFDLYWLYKFVRIEIPQQEQLIREREQRFKWLPKRKK